MQGASHWYATKIKLWQDQEGNDSCWDNPTKEKVAAALAQISDSEESQNKTFLSCLREKQMAPTADRILQLIANSAQETQSYRPSINFVCHYGPLLNQANNEKDGNYSHSREPLH